MPRLFISHAAKDEGLVEEFVDLLQVGIGVHPDDVFCSSLPGMNIPTGKAFIEHIRSQVINPELVLLVITPNFLRSQFCNNEVGATWALSLPIHPLLVPPIGFADVRGVLDGMQSAKLDDKEALNDLRDDLTEKFGLKPFKTSHWERKRDKFLARLNGLLGETASTATAESPEGAKAAAPVVSSSGAWMKLADLFIRVQRFEHHDSLKISVQLSHETAEEEAALKRLRPPEHGRGLTVAFAYQNEGGVAQISSVKSLSEGDKTVWSLELIVQERRNGGVWNEMAFNKYSAVDIAEMRVGRLLINVPPPPRRRSRGHEDEFLESIIAGSSDSPVRTDKCVVQAIVGANRGKLKEALCWARLEVVYLMKAAELVEIVLEFTLGPLQEDKLHVRFRGQRPSRNKSEAPEIIEIDGKCELS
jgi:hypothetical protein